MIFSTADISLPSLRLHPMTLRAFTSDSLSIGG
jgi:hypothetical protein